MRGGGAVCLLARGGGGAWWRGGAEHCGNGNKEWGWSRRGGEKGEGIATTKDLPHGDSARKPVARLLTAAAVTPRRRQEIGISSYAVVFAVWVVAAQTVLRVVASPGGWEQRSRRTTPPHRACVLLLSRLGHHNRSCRSSEKKKEDVREELTCCCFDAYSFLLVGWRLNRICAGRSSVQYAVRGGLFCSASIFSSRRTSADSAGAVSFLQCGQRVEVVPPPLLTRHPCPIRFSRAADEPPRATGR